jgi:hypothetical protein
MPIGIAGTPSHNIGDVSVAMAHHMPGNVERCLNPEPGYISLRRLALFHHIRIY